MSKMTKNYFILPVCFLLLNAFEEVVIYEVSKYPSISRNPYILTGAIILLCAVGFSLVGDFSIPYIRKLLERMHKGTRKHGALGHIFFILLITGLIFLLYFRIYTIGPWAVLPESWR